MKVEVHIHHHGGEALFELRRISQRLEEIMVKQTELAASLREVANTQRKTISEIQTLQGTVTTLTEKADALQKQLDEIGVGGEVTQELLDAAEEVRNLAAQADEEIPDVPAPPADPVVE